ncbi:TRAP transporter large permease [Alkalihalobacillus sp. MEB130]|uniref:TRAP transporter large permease n=1 Tax=Alkalihalobacillus sp. MEB130 TaxID=2976704 RepID=UPI0028DDDAB8|nr:TRAP transporter large permease [Alkalihalobacillus sp. MEB130]MDT8862881.1 TRAP transporter large permease [Alkalihalobacillus sp. MEB130]
MELMIALLILIITLIFGVPVPFVFLITTIFLVVSLGYDPSFLIPYGFSKLDNIVLLAIPLFIIAGGLMDKGGIARRIVDFTEIFFGKVKGGLGIVTVVACVIFGAISGSGAAALTSMGPILLPRLQKKGYSKGFATALITNASILGLLIPPSALMILYAWVGNQSVLASFLSTVIPGLILATLLCIINYIYMRRNDFKDESSNEISVPIGSRLRKSGISATPGLLMPIVVLGGIYGGIMTPTEAAAVAALYAIPVGFWIYKELNKKTFYTTLVESATTTGVIMVMIFSMMLLSRIFIMEDVPGLLTNFLLSITENTFLLLLMINIFILIIGMLMDDVSAVLLCTPILLPVVINLGVDPIHFAAIIGVNLGMGLLTPPTAPLLYLGSRVGKTSIKDIIGPALLMLLFAWLPTLLLTTYFPELVLFLPKLILGN